MNLLFQIFGLVLIVGIPVYLHACVKFAGIIQAERPEWIERCGSLRFFYTGRFTLADPNVQHAILGIAFSSRWREIGSSVAPIYVGRIRFLLPFLLIVFGSLIVAIFVFKP